eukprot:14264995-Ditylum_brightwellii.AAC.1
MDKLDGFVMTLAIHVHCDAANCTSTAALLTEQCDDYKAMSDFQRKNQALSNIGLDLQEQANLA